MLISSRPVIAFYLFALLPTVIVSSEGHAQVGAKNPAQAEDTADDLIAKLAILDSAGDFLTIDDLDKFRPGRPKDEILKDLRWRSGYFVAGMCNGRNIASIVYTLHVDGLRSHRSETLYALFVDDKFEKLIRWSYLNGPDRTKVGDHCWWLTQWMKGEAASIDELKKEAASLAPPPEHVDPGLTGMYLGMRAFGLAPGPPPADQDYEKLRKNAELRDHFNAARLRIGMTEAEVQATLKAKPLESGIVDAGNYSIYGSNERFDISDWHGFSLFLNILVVFRDGKAIAISSIGSGYDWRQSIERTLIDLPRRDAVKNDAKRVGSTVGESKD